VRVDDYVYEALSEQARRCGLSLYRYVQWLLKRVVSPPDEDVVEKVESASEWAKRAHDLYDNLESAVKKLREVVKMLEETMVELDATVGFVEETLDEVKRMVLTKLPTGKA
jgi:predicted HicB family RNase H-like nuclease